MSEISPIEELELLRDRVRELEAHIRYRAESEKALRSFSGRLLAKFFLGSRLYRSAQDCWNSWSTWLSDGMPPGKWPEHETRDVVSGLLVRSTRSVTFLLALGCLPVVLLAVQTWIFMQQTQIIANQTASITAQTRLLDNQLSIATEPVVRLVRNQAGPALNGVFAFQLVNSGAPTITDIDIGKEFYLLREERLQQIEVGGQSISPVYLSRGETLPFEIALPDNYQDLMTQGTLLVLINVQFAREVDLRQSEYIRVFRAQEEGYINDITMYGLEGVPDIREARDGLVARAKLNNVRERGARNPATPAHSAAPLRGPAGR